MDICIRMKIRELLIKGKELELSIQSGLDSIDMGRLLGKQPKGADPKC